MSNKKFLNLQIPNLLIDFIVFYQYDKFLLKDITV
jgi:hypothetical protein